VGNGGASCKALKDETTTKWKRQAGGGCLLGLQTYLEILGNSPEILISENKYDISWYIMQHVRKGAMI
jgi:hypothetical protein